MNDLEYDVLDELYFVTPYNEIENNLQIAKATLDEILLILLDKNYIQQLEFNKNQKEYKKCLTINKIALERYAYLASKKGLLAHNGLE